MLLLHRALNPEEVRMQLINILTLLAYSAVRHDLYEEIFVTREVIRVAHLLRSQRAQCTKLIRYLLLALVNNLASYILTESHLVHELAVWDLVRLPKAIKQVLGREAGEHEDSDVHEAFLELRAQMLILHQVVFT